MAFKKFLIQKVIIEEVFFLLKQNFSFEENILMSFDSE